MTGIDYCAAHLAELSKGEDGLMSDDEDLVTLTITLSRKAYEKAERQAKDPRGPMGEMAGFAPVTDYIERIVEVALED